jgi:exodeoxyribonuclease V
METLTHNTLTGHQSQIFKGICSKITTILEDKVLTSPDLGDYIVSLQGAAGTGKTYLTTQIVKFLKTSNINFMITAPTHKAVSVIANTLTNNGIVANCKTIHSFLGVKAFKDYETGAEKFIIDKTVKQDQATAVLIVD